MHGRNLMVATTLCLVLAVPAAVLAWGNSPTHFSIAAGLADENPELTSPTFLRASAAPDIAWTTLFRSTGRTYVHSREFAESLRAVAQTDEERLMALAFGAHIVADEVGHGAYIPEASPVHDLVEVAIDTIIFYDHQQFPLPPGVTAWEQVNVKFDPGLLFRASVHYARKKRVPLVWPWLAAQALESLKGSINVGYGYIKLKKNDDLSQAFLAELASQGVVPSADFSDTYDQAVAAAAAWINGQP